jgi:hypothetical protein
MFLVGDQRVALFLFRRFDEGPSARAVPKAVRMRGTA